VEKLISGSMHEKTHNKKCSRTAEMKISVVRLQSADFER